MNFTRVVAKTPHTTRPASSSCSRVTDASSSTALPSEHIPYHQRSIGNQVAGNILRFRVLQPKPDVGHPDDVHEQQADRAEEQVMGMPEQTAREKPGPSLATVLTCQEEGKAVQGKDVLRKTSAVSSDLGSGINAVTAGGGQHLSISARSFFEPRFGYDFSGVRVHTDTEASNLAKTAGARALTLGQDIVFNAGQFAPGTSTGQRLLAHELTHVVQQGDQNNSRSMVQRKDGGDIKTIDWMAGVDMAESAAKNLKTKDVARDYYRELVVRAAQKVTAPSPLVDKKPAVEDILWSWTSTSEYAATTDPKKVDKAPDDHWKWLTFNPGAVLKEEAFTVSTILHELDHAAHAKTLYDEWKKASSKKKESWADFYIDHYTKWTEKEIKIEKVGLAGALAGLPEKISPSAIEFRAYANQFVNYFHKVSPDKQEYMAKAIILFYPLKIQKPEAKISDPTLDLSKARQQILDYFKAPPVKDKAQQDIIKIRVASELKSALFLFRPAEDHGQIKTDFKEILEYEIDPDERREARRNYKPEAL